LISLIADALFNLSLLLVFSHDVSPREFHLPAPIYPFESRPAPTSLLHPSFSCFFTLHRIRPLPSCSISEFPHFVWINSRLSPVADSFRCPPALSSDVSGYFPPYTDVHPWSARSTPPPGASFGSRTLVDAFSLTHLLRPHRSLLPATARTSTKASVLFPLE